MVFNMEGSILENAYLGLTPLTSTVNEFLLQSSVIEPDESLLKRIVLEANQNVLTTTRNIFLEEGGPVKKKKCKKKLGGSPKCKQGKSLKKRRLCARADRISAYIDRSLSRDMPDTCDMESIPLSYEGGVALGPPPPPPPGLLSTMSSGRDLLKPSVLRSVRSRIPSGIQMQQQCLLPPGGNEFCFGSAAVGQVFSAAHINITEMPVYSFESEDSSVDNSVSLKFSSREADTFHLERVLNIKSKKMQLYNAASMALICAANFRDAGNSYRNFIENSADALRSIDPEFILKVAIYARQELNIRSVCNFLLSYAAFHEETRIFLEKYFDASIRLPLDWLEVADIYQTFNDERLKKGSLPACLKKVLKNSFQKFDEYQLAKYNRDKTKKKKNKVLQGFTLKQLIRLLHIDSPANEVMCLLGKKYPESGEQFNKSGLPGAWDSKLAGKRMKLPQPITWETQVSANGNKANVWEGIIDANKLPYMAMLRNIRNLILSGISQKHHDKVLKYLENKNAVINCRQVPLQFFEAYKVVEELKVLLTKDKEEICKPSLTEWKKKHAEKVYEKIHKASSIILSRYQEAINKALEISSLHNLCPIPGKTLILCDTIFLNQEKVKKQRKVQSKALETCTMMGLMIKKACEHGLMYLVDTHDATRVTFDNDSNFLEVLQNECEKIESQFSTRWTQREVEGLEEILSFYLKQQVILSEKLDHIIFLRISDDKEYEKSVSSFLNKYRETVNPDLLYTDVNLVLSNKSFSNQHSDDERDIYLCGNSPQLIKFISERSNNGQLTCVENIDKKYDLKSIHNSFPVKKVGSDDIDENTIPAYSREPKWHSVRIFISSTFKDMHSERDMLVRYVMPELRRRASSVFVKINEVDLRWGITEADCTTKRAAELCLIEAEKCDLFIGLLGQRYGSVYTYGTPDCPELQWVKDYPQSLSITELEMHAGALRPEKLANKRAFFYFRKSNFLSEVPPKYQEYFISETPDSKLKLEELKTKIRNSGLPVFDGYDCKFAGALKEKPILSGLDSFGKAIIEDLWNVIKDIHEKEPPLDCVSEEEKHQQHLLSNFHCFIGARRFLAENLAKTINKECGIFLITGASGCGKTTFAVDLLNKLQNFIVIKFFIGLTPRSTNVNYMLHFISESIARKLPVSAVFPNSPSDVKNNFPEILQQAVDSGRDFILLLDGIDYLDSDGQLLDWLPLHLPKRLRLICTASESSHASKVLLERQAFDNKLYLENLIALPQSEKESVVRHYLSLFGKTLDESSFNNQMLLMVTKKDSGIPMYLRLACDFLRTYASFETFVPMLQSLPTSSVLLLQEVIIQMENEYGSILIQSALTLLCITKEGLDDRDLHVLLSIVLMDKASNASNSWEKTIQKFISLNPDSLISQVTFCSMLHSICNFSFRQSRPSSLSLAGSELEKAVKKYYLNKNYSNFQKSMHFLLAAYYYSICDPDNNAKFTTRSGYAFRGLLSHLFNGRCTPELASLLCNLQFLEACFYVDCGEILQEYYLNILEEKQRGRRDTKEIDFDVLESYKNFVCRNLHILNRHPELTQQQAYNEPTGSHVKIDVGDIKSLIIACVSEPIVSDHRLSTLNGFIQPITAVSYEESRRIAVLGSKDGYLKILDYSSKRVIRNLKSHTSAITFVCFGGKSRICTASNDTTLNIWSSEDYSLISVLKGHRQSVTCCCADPTGGVLLSSSWDNTVRLWSLLDGRSISTIDFRCPVNCIDHHPYKQQVTCGLWNSCIEVWDTVSLKKVFTAKSHCGSVKSIVYSSDGVNIISSFINSDIVIWSAEEGLKVANLKGHALPVKSLVFSVEKNLIVSGSEDCTLKIWPTADGVCINKLSECRFCPISMLEIISHDLLAIVFQNSEMWIMNMYTGSVEAKFVINSDIVSYISKPSDNIDLDTVKQQKWTEMCVIFGTQSGKVLCGNFTESSVSSIGLMKFRVTSIVHNPKMIVCGNSDGDIGVFRYPDYKSAYVYGVHKGSVLSLHLFGKYFPLVMSSGYDKVLKIWRIDIKETIELMHYEDVTTKHSDGILCSYYVDYHSIYPRYYLSGSHDNNIIMTEGYGEKILCGLKTSVINVCFSNDYIIGCANDGSVAMWSIDGKLSSYVPGIDQSSTILSFLVEKNVAGGVFDVTLAYVDKDGSVKITKPIQKLYWYSLEGHSKSITSCSINRNGEIISSSLDGTINVWKISADTPDAFLNHKSSINGILISNENKMLITSDVQGTILLWKPNDVSKRFSLVCVGKKTYTGGFIKAIALSKTSTFIVAVTQVRENKEDIHFLDTISILSQKSDGHSYYQWANSTELADPEAPDSYSLRTTHTHSLDSEVLCLDTCQQSQTVVVTFKNGELLVITPQDKKKLKLSDEWIIGARILFCEDSVEHLFLSLSNGSVKTFLMSTVLDENFCDNSWTLSSSLEKENSLYTTAFYCINKDLLVCGDTKGYLKIHKNDITSKKIHESAITGIAVIDHYIFTSSLDKTVKGWKLSSLEQVCQYHSPVPITSLKASEICLGGFVNANTLIIGTIFGGVEVLQFV
ncbi:telomerase protein component 1 isoform X3 [Parasteatoda tepidariorum]|uniref:telomerase protein component 1 isoform X3 n=1 Tax=Parasteatoda tepidariorum TaxID=114398 RepID=UPI001C71DA05|nr:telomerase protein component 1 isoform X3 [Parasteatoda tepidariorum]